MPAEGYIAIARKYRPQTLDGMAGQQHVVRTLRNALASGRVHHAFLFTGARGVGKTTTARALARALNCEKGPTVEPCGQCAPCREILAGSATDVIEIDGASNNSVEDVRDLRDGVRYVPASARFKIYIIDEVHMLSKGAFNALLKTLEEPPPHVKFIFATTEVHKIPETILSRVQRFDFKRIPAGTVVTYLKKIAEAEGVTLSEASLRLVARAGEGSMRDSQGLLDQVISFGGKNPTDAEVADILGAVDRTALLDVLGGLLRGETDTCLAVIDRVYEGGFDLGQFTAELLEVMRNAALLALSPGAAKYVDASEEDKERLKQLVAGVPAEQLARMFDTLVEVHDQVARSARPRLVLDMAVARLVTIRPAQPLAQLVDRLSDLERRLRGAGSAATAASAPRAPGGGAPAPAASARGRSREPRDDAEAER